MESLTHKPGSKPVRTAWISLFLLILIWSLIEPKDYLTWILETFPAIIGFFIVQYYDSKTGITPFLLWLILIHSAILMIGGHYTYSEVPLFEISGGRNNFDKVGHFIQGFTPAIISREILFRQKAVSAGWLNFICISIAVFVSAVYELIEMFAALLLGSSADQFLGTQGFVWDTQTDILLALIGSMVAIYGFRKLHFNQLKKFISPN